MKDLAIRTLIAVDEGLLEELKHTLNECRKELAKGAERERQLRVEITEHKPMTEKQAAEYLGRDLPSLRYYRTLGLESFKKGGSRWYTKALIDEWLATGKVTMHKK